MATQPKPAWIEWTGGECPVQPDTLVEVIERGGRSTEGHRPCDAAFWNAWGDNPDHWADNDHDNDVAFYRVVGAA